MLPPTHQCLDRTKENLRRWEKSGREAVICNQAAGFNRCLFKVQDNMQQQLKTIQTDQAKGKFSSKVSSATDELQYLMDFNSSICQAKAKTMEHLSDFVFVPMANLTLARRDSYLSHVKSGIKSYTLAALRTAPLQLAILFPEDMLKRAAEDIVNFENKGHSSSRKVLSLLTSG